ncbi:hypothetical protein MCUN1_003422 [Malassezia cuniculi]|uniref:Major facilitator superfamily (MFS) profile domain-containing protein n=1 Tax=Malassezia cuniculi TaxID=948313 RepID=A0AAF0J887_9BASI|nr:hypothetical protein MCUN1_003422 [Malassezia cuniculi]
MQWTAHLDGVALDTPLVPLRIDPRGGQRHRALAFAVLYVSLLMLAFVITLDSMTSFLYLNYACSEFDALGSFGTVSIVQQLVCAVCKPPIAMAAERLGRVYALLMSLVFATLGYTLMGYAGSLPVLVAGVLVQSVGYTGIQVLQTVIIADTTSAKWRGLVLGALNVPFLVNFAIAGPLADHMLVWHGWRSGYLLWAIVVPLAAAPLLITLAIGARLAKGHVNHKAAARAHVFSDLDIVGMALFSGGITLILLPLSLSSRNLVAWGPERVEMVAGVVLLAVFAWWEKRAEHPFIPCALLANPTVLLICAIGMLDFAGFYISWTFLSAFVQVIKDWNQTSTAYFASSQNVVATIFGIVAGWALVYLKRFKVVLVLGIAVRLVGVALMVRYRGVDHTTTMLVVCQIVQGIGGGTVGLTMQVAAQVAVNRSRVALVTALELLTTEIGAAFGAAIAGALFSTALPPLLHKHVPNLSDDELRSLAGSLAAVHRYSMDTPERQGIATAWSGVMRLLSIMAFLIQVPALVFALLVPDADLHDKPARQPKDTPKLRETTSLLAPYRAPAWRACSGAGMHA